MSCTSCPLELQFKTEDSTTTVQDSHLDFKIINNGTSAQDMTVISVKYFYLAQTRPNPTVACYYANGGGCGSITETFATLSAPKSNADSSVEFQFTSGSLAAGGGNMEFHVGLHNTGFGASFDESKDYSFSTSSSYADSMTSTMYRSGTLIWGTEP
jgi:endo-1,4-beta-xylanase